MIRPGQGSTAAATPAGVVGIAASTHAGVVGISAIASAGAAGITGGTHTGAAGIAAVISEDVAIVETDISAGAPCSSSGSSHRNCDHNYDGEDW